MTENDVCFANGRCACDGVRYHLTSRPLFVHCCHCRWCQRETGSAFVLNAMIESTRVVLTKGVPSKIMIPSESGKGQQMVRCPECQTTLWSHYSGIGDKVSFVRAGTLDEPALTPPDIHIFTSTKLPWVQLPQDIPAVREYYSRKDYWPEASIARVKNATGR